MSLIRQRHGDANQLGFVLQLALLRGPGIALGPDTAIPDALMARMASNLVAPTDRGQLLVEAVIASMRRAGIAPPAVEVIEPACAQGLIRATRHLHTTLSEPLDTVQRSRLDALLRRRPEGPLTQIG